MAENGYMVAQPLPLSGGTSRPADWPSVGSRLPLPAAQSLSARSGSSTARSGLETPRTSTFTGGTPRDAQRLALGERPPDSDRDRRPGPEGWPGAPSPQQTARSSVFSSDAWSMTPSSQGDALSSGRSRTDSLNYSPEQDFAMACAQTHAAAASAVETASYHMDLQKSLEVMRFVIMKENQKLKELLEESRTSLADITAQLDTELPSPSSPSQPTLPVISGASSGSSAAQEPCRVEWRLQNMTDVLSLGQHAMDVDHVEQTSFRLPAFPGLHFELRFHPWSTAEASHQHTAPQDIDTTTSRDASEASGQPRRLRELQLDVSGASAGQDLRVTLSIGLEGLADGDCRSSSVSTMLSGGGVANCVDAWPSSWPGSGAVKPSVVCRVELEELSWSPGHLSLNSSWQQPS